MIINQSVPFFEVDALLAGLQRAVQAVVRVSGSRSGTINTLSTGWLITNTLVVIPDYVLSEKGGDISETEYYCYVASQPGEAIRADVISASSTKELGSMPALLRLHQPLPKQAMRLAQASVHENDQVFLLHYPEGRPRTSLSIGQILRVDGATLQYDANTAPGSGGGPILNINWDLIGMHTSSGQMETITSAFNKGLSLATILAGLRELPVWDEIARYHNLADVTAALQKLEHYSEASVLARLDDAFLHAAVRWNFDPTSLPQDDLDQLRPLVIDPLAPRWALQTSERQRLLRSAGSLELLRKARGTEVIDDPGQQVIDRILAGPPFALEEVEEAQLPHWLQAVRWFADVVSALPTPVDVNRALQRRRVRSRLRAITGSDFRGRTEELAELHAWYQEASAGPIVITGIGGVGKSALVAQFAVELPQQTLLLWLDFDRADLAPDDAVSVLSLLEEQVSAQLEGFVAPPVDESAWQQCVTAFGAALAPLLKQTPAPLLVLDGFEVAQYVQQHQEIWRVLELILAQIPMLHVVVSGRAPVKNLKLYNRSARTRHLKGMVRADAEVWLREHGITDTAVLARVLDISEGVPLVLKLALRLVETGGDVQDLPQELPKTLIEGFLYQRILDRVIDPSLKRVARDALVLRSLTVEMIPAVLGDSTPAELDAHGLFSRLAREMGLVSGEDVDQIRAQVIPVTLGAGSGILRLRPEVRSATLKLLEIDNPTRVRTIDARAAAWYADQDLREVANAAELVYHRLRLGDVAGAEQMWRVECAPLLLFAEDDLPEDAHAARGWLRARTGDTAIPSLGLETWELEATRRIRTAIGRGLLRAVPKILDERPDRSGASPLVLYDAWTHWYAGDLAAARDVLGAAGQVDGPVGRDRALLGALLATHAGDRREADRLLMTIEAETNWIDRTDRALESLAVGAARVRLTVDLRAEIDLVQMLMEDPSMFWGDDTLRRFLRPGDVVLPALSERIGGTASFERLESGIGIPTNRSELASFASQLDRERQAMIDDAFLSALPLTTDAPMNTDGPWSGHDLGFDKDMFRFSGNQQRPVESVLNLAVLGWRRWRIATTSLFLAQACEQALQTDAAYDPLRLSVVSTLAAFHSKELRFSSGSEYFHSLDEVINKRLVMMKGIVVPAAAGRVLLASQALRHESQAGHISATLATWVEGTAERDVQLTDAVPDFLPGTFFTGVEHHALRSVLLYLLGPDPLEMLFRRVVGFPDSLAL